MTTANEVIQSLITGINLFRMSRDENAPLKQALSDSLDGTLKTAAEYLELRKKNEENRKAAGLPASTESPTQQTK